MSSIIQLDQSHNFLATDRNFTAEIKSTSGAGIYVKYFFF